MRLRVLLTLVVNGIVAARNRDVGPQGLRQGTLVRTARNADDRGAARLGELDVQLAGDTESENHDELAREDVDLTLCMQARCQHLDQRRDTRFD